MSARRLLLIGPPGAGKGTQAGLLAARLGITQVATGDMLRAAVAAGTEVGKRAKARMDAGELVDDELVTEVAKERLAQEDARRGFVLDGFPRTAAQAKSLDEMLPRLGVALERCVVIEVDEEELVKRLLARAQIEGRSDDNEASIRVRMQAYREKTRPLVEHYRELGLLVNIDGSGDIEEVARRIEAALG